MFGVNNKTTFEDTFPTIENDLSLLYSVLPGDSIATRIYKLRKLYDLSFKEFGDKVGVGPTTAHKWENEVREPSKESLDKVIKAFNLYKDYFNMEKG